MVFSRMQGRIPGDRSGFNKRHRLSFGIGDSAHWAGARSFHHDAIHEVARQEVPAALCWLTWENAE